MKFSYSLISNLKDQIFQLAKQITSHTVWWWWAYLDASLDSHDCDQRGFTSSFCGEIRQRDEWKIQDINMSVGLLSRCISDSVNTDASVSLKRAYQDAHGIWLWASREVIRKYFNCSLENKQLLLFFYMSEFDHKTNTTVLSLSGARWQLGKKQGKTGELHSATISGCRQPEAAGVLSSPRSCQITSRDTEWLDWLSRNSSTA